VDKVKIAVGQSQAEALEDLVIMWSRIDGDSHRDHGEDRAYTLL
jgi:hypothetical protein